MPSTYASLFNDQLLRLPTTLIVIKCYYKLGTFCVVQEIYERARACFLRSESSRDSWLDFTAIVEFH